MIPRPSVFQKPEYIKAVDAALLKCRDGERIIYETVDGFVVDVEVHEILAEKDLIESKAGFTRTQRLRATKSQVVRPPASGCIVRGTLRVLRGSLPDRSWFGLGEHDAFSVKLGDGLLSEGFVACLTDIKQGSSAKCTISGECLLPDLCSEEEQHAIVPVEYWASDQSEDIDLPSVILEVSVTAIDDTGKKHRDPMTMSLAEKEERSKVLKERVRECAMMLSSARSSVEVDFAIEEVSALESRLVDIAQQGYRAAGLVIIGAVKSVASQKISSDFVDGVSLQTCPSDADVCCVTFEAARCVRASRRHDLS